MTFESMRKFFDLKSRNPSEMAAYASIPLEYWNPRPENGNDCVVRSLAKALGADYDETKSELIAFQTETALGYDYTEYQTYGSFLCVRKGYSMINAQACGTLDGYRFCKTFAEGVYVVRTEGHVYAVVDGCAYDAWNALGDEIVAFWRAPGKEEKKADLIGEAKFDAVWDPHIWNRR